MYSEQRTLPRSLYLYTETGVFQYADGAGRAVPIERVGAAARRVTDYIDPNHGNIVVNIKEASKTYSSALALRK